MHVITGQIRKEPYTKTGTNAKGEWKMYAVELSESWKDREGTRQYTNYRSTLFASSPGAISYYDEVLAQGSVVSITCETLQVNQREHDGKNYVTLEPVNPRLEFARAPEGQQQAGKSGTTGNNGGTPRNPNTNRPQNNSPANGNEPPMDFDDDIPF